MFCRILVACKTGLFINIAMRGDSIFMKDDSQTPKIYPELLQ